MKYVKILPIFLLFTSLGISQTHGAPISSSNNVHPIAAPAAPAISDAEKAKFFKAQVESMRASTAVEQAQKAAEQTQAKFMDVIKEIQKDCGEEFQPSLDKDGDLVCIVKPPKVAANNK